MKVIGQLINQVPGKDKGFYITFREKETNKLFNCFSMFPVKHNPTDENQCLDIQKGYNQRCWLVKSLKFNQIFVKEKTKSFEVLKNYRKKRELVYNNYQTSEKLIKIKQKVKQLELEKQQLISERDKVQRLLIQKEHERLEQDHFNKSQLKFKDELIKNKDYLINQLEQIIANKPEYQFKNIVEYLTILEYKKNKTAEEIRLLQELQLLIHGKEIF